MPAIGRRGPRSAASSPPSPPPRGFSPRCRPRFSRPHGAAARSAPASVRRRSRRRSPRATRRAAARTSARRMRFASACASRASCSRTPRPARYGRRASSPAPCRWDWRWEMRVVGRMALGLVLLAGSARADEIYRSTDSAGRPFFSNGPGASGDARRDVAPAAAPPTEEAETFSTSASLRRQALERDLRTTERRLRDLDAQLATLGRARTRNAGGSEATGGVRAAADDVRSEEEQSLAAERAQVLQHVADVRAAYATLRDEVTARLGANPSWWIEPR